MTKVYGTVSRKRRSELALIAKSLAGNYLRAALDGMKFAGLTETERDIVYRKIRHIADRLRIQGYQLIRDK